MKIKLRFALMCLFFVAVVFDCTPPGSSTSSSGGGGGAPSTYTVTYNANGATSGSVLTDSNKYLQGATVTVLGSGTIVRTGDTFAGWNTLASGGGSAYTAGATFKMPAADVTLYAAWVVGLPSDDALSSLTLGNQFNVLTPAFSPTTYSYKVQMNTAQNRILALSAVPDDPKAVLSIVPTPVAGGVPIATYPTIVDITVTAQNGAQALYTVEADAPPTLALGASSGVGCYLVTDYNQLEYGINLDMASSVTVTVSLAVSYTLANGSWVTNIGVAGNGASWPSGYTASFAPYVNGISGYDPQWSVVVTLTDSAGDTASFTYSGIAVETP